MYPALFGAVVMFAVTAAWIAIARSEREAAPLVVAVIPLLLGLSFLFVACYSLAERRGCIDAMTGKPAYILTTQPDGSVVWTRKE